MTRRGVRLNVSDTERTVLDCLNRPELSGGMAGVCHVFALAKPRLNWTRFGVYLNRLGRRSLVQRAGFLSELVRPSVKAPWKWLNQRRPREEVSYVPLGPPSR
jgi:predicted transcriptional regulator of viral defense system